jgi:hypothetical protein
MAGAFACQIRTLEVFEEVSQNGAGTLLSILKRAIFPDVLEGGIAVAIGCVDAPPHFGGVSFEEDDRLARRMVGHARNLAVGQRVPAGEDSRRNGHRWRNIHRI